MEDRALLLASMRSLQLARLAPRHLHPSPSFRRGHRQPPASAHTRDNPYLAPLIDKRPLTCDVSSKLTLHLAFNISGSDVTLRSGRCLRRHSAKRSSPGRGDSPCPQLQRISLRPAPQSRSDNSARCSSQPPADHAAHPQDDRGLRNHRPMPNALQSSRTRAAGSS